MAGRYQETSGLDKELDKWIPREVQEHERKAFIGKFHRLANKVKEVTTFLPSHPIVASHPHYDNFEFGGLIRDSIYADYFNLYFTYAGAQDLVAGFSFQLLNDLFLYNIEDCTFWTFDTFSDFMNGGLLLVEDNAASEAFLSFMYGFHKMPLAYYKCENAISDTESL